MILTQEQALELFRYDPETGYLYWKNTGTGRPKYNVPAGHTSKSTGYAIVKLRGKAYKAHRIIWLMFYGDLPERQIDHINHIRSDNRIGNLRSVSNQGNQRNATKQKNNSSGVTGVHWDSRAMKWKSRIYIGNKDIPLGYYSHIFPAACARKAAENKYGFHPNHGR